MYIKDTNWASCAGCDHPDSVLPRYGLPVPFLPRAFGAGDAVAAAAHAAGLVPCAPCEARRQWLNQFYFRPWGER